MNSQTPQILPIAIVGAIIAAVYFGVPGVTPATPKPPGPDMVAVFAANPDRVEARAHAAALGSICRAIANQLEYDGSRKAPRYTTGVRIDDLRLRVREYRMGGWSFLTKYPQMSATIESYMESQLGKSGGPVTPEQRRQWVETFRALGKCCDYAAK